MPVRGVRFRALRIFSAPHQHKNIVQASTAQGDRSIFSVDQEMARRLDSVHGATSPGPQGLPQIWKFDGGSINYHSFSGTLYSERMGQFSLILPFAVEDAYMDITFDLPQVYVTI